jgi:hypothetical protein
MKPRSSFLAAVVFSILGCTKPHEEPRGADDGGTLQAVSAAPPQPSAAAPSSASTSTAPSAVAGGGLPPVAPGARAEVGPGLVDDPFSKWVDARAAQARAGKREIVRLPVGIATGGATVPDTFIGAWMGGAIMGGDIGLSPEWEAGVPKPAGMQTWIVEGWFTGTRTTEGLGGGGGGPTWPIYGFHGMRSRTASSDPDGNPEADARRVQVLLAGDEATRELPALHDDRRWLAVAATLPLTEADVDAHAERARARLVADGLESAEIIDSRQAAGLSCCFRVIVAGRYAAEKDAAVTVGKAKHAFAGAYVRKGW